MSSPGAAKLVPMTQLRVEDAGRPGLNGFHRHATGKIIDGTLADLFNDNLAGAKFFARQCKEAFPQAQVVIADWKWFVDERGHVITHPSREVWRP